MKRSVNGARLCLLGCVLLVFSGCHETFETFFAEMGKNNGWNKEQTLVAKYDAYKMLFLKKQKENLGYDIFYSRLTNREVLEKIQEMRQALNEALDYKDEQTVKYIDRIADTRLFLEHQERVLEAISRRLQTRELQNEFNALMGIEDSNDPGEGEGNERHIVDAHYRYAPELLFVVDPRSIFTMNSRQLTEARKHGTLREIQKLLINTDAMLAYQEPDPNDPTDANKFIWKPRSMGMEFKSYKIYHDFEHPRNNKPHYIEGHRVWLSADTAGEQLVAYREVLPAVTVFYNPDRDNGVVVIDVDQEYESGYGIPDIVKPSGAINRLDLFAVNDVLEEVFPVKIKQRRIKPVEHPMKVEIAPVGEPIDVWEASPDASGWKVPVMYRNEKEDNYHVKLKFRMPDIFGLDKKKALSFVKKEWFGNHVRVPGPGAVIEYYRLKAPYNQELIDAKVLYKEDTKRVLFVLSDGSEVRGMIIPGPNIFIEEKPYAVDYSDGDIRWRLESTKRDGIYDRRKKVSPPVPGSTGEYEKPLEGNDGSDHHGH